MMYDKAIKQTFCGEDPKQAQAQPIMYQMDMMEKALLRMQEVFVQLEGRLSPISRPTAQESEPVPENKHGKSAISERLHAFNLMTEKLITDIAMLHDSLEI